MRAFTILFTTCSLASAAVLTPRDANTVYNDISGINTAVLELTSTLNAYTGGIEASKPVFAAAIDIHSTCPCQPLSSRDTPYSNNNTNALPVC